LWDTAIRTETEAVTNKKLEYNAKNLNDLRWRAFLHWGMLEMDEQQKPTFCRPSMMMGRDCRHSQCDHHVYRLAEIWRNDRRGHFDEHPWGTFDAPIMSKTLPSPR